MVAGVYLFTVGDGVNTVTLTSEPDGELAYLPLAAEPGAVTVSEVCALYVGGASLSAAVTERDKLARLLEQAGRVAAGSGEARVFVTLQRDSALPVWRSELLGGELREGDVEGYWIARAVLRLRVAWVRRAFWEGARVEIPLLDVADAEQTGGMEVLSSAGPRGGGYRVDLAAVAGSLPAPLELRFTNLAAATAVYYLHASLRSSAAAITFSALIEGESARSGGSTAPAGVDEQYSGGKYRALSWSGTSAAMLCDWDVTGAELALGAGRWYRVVSRWCPAPAYTDLLIQARLTIAGATIVWAGPWVKSSASFELTGLGSVPLPPWDGVLTSLAPLRLEFWAKRATVGSHSANLDYIALLGLDGYRVFSALGTGLAQNEVLVDDGTEGLTYAVGSSGSLGYWRTDGGWLYVRPGCQHRLSLLWAVSTGVAGGDKLGKVRLYYRPRVVVP